MRNTDHTTEPAGQSPSASLPEPLSPEASPHGMPSPTPRPLASVEMANEQLNRLQQQLNRLQRTVRLTIEAEIASLSGLSFGSLAANQSVVAMLQEMIDAHGLRVRCPECGHPAILRCSPRPGVPAGVFVLDHTIDGRRTFHGGGATVPEIRLVAKPARRSSKKAS